MAQDYEITKVPVEPYRWNVHQYARITALAAWMVFFGAGHPRNLPGNYRGDFCGLFSRARAFSLKKNSSTPTSTPTPSPVTISPPSP